MSTDSTPTIRTVLLTGGAGFIGSHLGERLASEGYRVVVLDNFNDYYDPDRKRDNARRLEEMDVAVEEGDIRDRATVERLFERNDFDAVVHLAAMPGVRASVQRPATYFDVNLNGTIVLLEAARHVPGIRFVFGSSSSVYGMSERLPFREDDPDLRPVSPYASSKRAGELICYTYHHLYDLSITALRFFTVYGPRQRPEMAISRFTEKILAGEEIPLYGDGSARRDFTHVRDVVQGTVRAVERCGGFHVYNLGESETVTVLELIRRISEHAGREARVRRLPAEAGDVPATWADVTRAREDLGYDPRVSLDEGLRDFVDWYRRSRAERRVSS